MPVGLLINEVRTMNEIKLKLLDTGITSLISGYVDFFNVDLHSFIIGDSVNFTPDTGETSPRGNITFTGGRENLKLKISNEDKDLKVSLTIPEEYNEIKIGNIVLYTYQGGTIKPFCMLVLTELVIKRNPSSLITDQFFKYPANRMVISISITYVDVDSIGVDYTINVETPNFANLPYFGNDFQIPVVEENPHPQFVVNQMLSLGGYPTFVSKNIENTHYFASPVFQDIGSPKFGILNSLRSDYHEDLRVTWVWGQTYTTPEEGFRGVVGGTAYTETENITKIGGLSY